VIAPSNVASRRTVEKVSGGVHRRVGTFYHLQLGPLRLDRFVPLSDSSGGRPAQG
jgi:hypothetical protein